MLHNRSPVHQPDDKLYDDHADGRHRRDKLARLAVTLLMHSAAAAVLHPCLLLTFYIFGVHRRFKEGLVLTALRL